MKAVSLSTCCYSTIQTADTIPSHCKSIELDASKHLVPSLLCIISLAPEGMLSCSVRYRITSCDPVGSHPLELP